MKYHFSVNIFLVSTNLFCSNSKITGDMVDFAEYNKMFIGEQAISAIFMHYIKDTFTFKTRISFGSVS